MTINYIDLIVLVVAAFIAFEATRHGFFVALFDLFSFAGSLLISLKTYYFLSQFIQEKFLIERSFSNVLGFIIVAIACESLLSIILGILLKYIPKKLEKSKLLKSLSVIPGVGEALVLISFLLLLIIGLPISPKIKNVISTSKVSSYLIKRMQNTEVTLKNIFGGVVEETISYIIVDPESNKIVPLEVNVFELRIDKDAEIMMYELVNEERQKANVEKLEWFNPAIYIAEEYAEYMWNNKYFGHISPDGGDVGDRLDDAKIKYFIVGENLALASTTQTAMMGLMNSEGHRRNILDPNFDKLSVGVVDNGIYGKMYVQIFVK